MNVPIDESLVVGEDTQIVPILDSVTGESVVGYGFKVDGTVFNVYPNLSDGVVSSVEVVVIRNGGLSSTISTHGLELDGLEIDYVLRCVEQMSRLLSGDCDVMEAMNRVFTSGNEVDFIP